jgi:3-methyl-2-oxobutanoate hydroxymethyltransferase
VAKKRPTVADIRANKGKYQYSKIHLEDWEELAAAEQAGIDIISVLPDMMLDPRLRELAPTAFVVPGMSIYDHLGTTDDFLRWGYKMLSAGADAVYCPASFQTVSRMADEGIPVIGHVGLIPSKSTWTGGYKAVGKTAESAMDIWNMVKQYEDAGAFGAEIEVVPPDIAAEVSKRTSLFMISMGSGSGCDAQYLFSTDILGENRGHVPKHSKVYQNFAAERDRLQQMRIAAFKEYAADVKSGAFPEAAQLVKSNPTALESFKMLLEK